MRRSLLSWLAALALVVTPSFAWAQEHQSAFHEEYVQESTQVVEGGEIQQTGLFREALSNDCGAPACGAPEACTDNNTCCEDEALCQPKCRSVYGMVELLVFEPQIGSFNIGGLGIGQITPDFNMQVSPRITLGVENNEGLGGRIRYWHFDHDTTTIAPLGGTVGINQTVFAQSLDLEVTQNAEFRKWQLQGFGGFRYANMKYSLGIADLTGGAGSGDLDVKFEGVGPTIGASALRPVGSGRASLYGTGRASMVFGDTRLGGTGIVGALLNPVNLRVDEHSMQIFEIGMGVQYGHGPLFARLGYEGQIWDSGLPLVNFNVGFWGPTMAVGFIR